MTSAKIKTFVLIFFGYEVSVLLSKDDLKLNFKNYQQLNDSFENINFLFEKKTNNPVSSK